MWDLAGEAETASHSVLHSFGSILAVESTSDRKFDFQHIDFS